MKAQEVFNIVYNHLLTQNERSKMPEGSFCAYRSETGLKCAVGCLITDQEYRKGMEGLDVECLRNAGYLPERLIPHISMLNALQYIHDSTLVENWKDELKAYAIDFHLKIPN